MRNIADIIENVDNIEGERGVAGAGAIIVHGDCLWTSV
jgi:hypothetical protein